MADRLAQLEGISKAVPGLNQKARGQAQAAQGILQQRAIGAAPQDAGAQQIATAAATSAGQSAFAQRQREQGVAAEIGQQALGATAASGQAKVEEQAVKQREALAKPAEGQALQLSREMLQSRKTMLQKEIDQSRDLQLHGVFMDNNLQIASINQRRDLSALGRGLDDKLLYSRLKFAKDNRGRKYLNERQLQDYLISNAETTNEFNSQMKKLQHQADRKLQTMRAAHAQLEQVLRQGYKAKKNDLDRETQLVIADAAKRMKARIQREQQRSKSRQQQWQSGSAVIGAIAGGVIGGPGGAVVGSQIGSGVGSVIGSAQS